MKQDDKQQFIVWHGSPRTFDRFDFLKLRDALGVFFTESRESAAYYARRGGRSPDGMVRQYRLSFRNVLRVQEREIAALSDFRDFLLPLLMNGQLKV